ncbi:MAG: hypothetical protein HC800_17580 [Phormidesmis sp. RL_2_1]|nr:hypothetical protein [Phormidesmis sp. RL_2_1]
MASGPNLQGNHSPQDNFPQDNFPQDNPQDHNFLQRSHDSGAEAPQSGFFRPRPILKPGLDVSERYSGPSPLPTVVEDARLPADLALNDVAVTDLAPPQQPKFWQRQPYRGMAYFAAVGGTVTAAWLLGILVAQVLPGNFDQPPLQEAFLRKTSRLASRLWHFPQLWHSPSDQLQIEAIPLPETGPLLTPVELSPIERQPLIDELNSIETELLTLDRRLNALEKQLGRPPYQATDMSIRVNSLRAAIDPPLQPAMKAAAYQPVPASQNDRLLEVVRLKIMLPSDAIFSPGQSQLKQTDYTQSGVGSTRELSPGDDCHSGV